MFFVPAKGLINASEVCARTANKIKNRNFLIRWVGYQAKDGFDKNI
jgi:hypothetical protein